MQLNNILISRTDSIGDVVLTLPMAGVIKEHYPNSKIFFLGRTYTKPIVSCSNYVDEFVNYDDLSSKDIEKQVYLINQLNIDAAIHVFPKKEIASLFKKSNVKYRIGTSHRMYHILTCNKLVNFSRKKSELHESQLNLKLLSGINIESNKSLDELALLNEFNLIEKLPKNLSSLISEKKKNIIFHPKSKGSAVEWGVENFNKLAELLPLKDYNIFITGTKEEGQLIESSLIKKENIFNLTGKMNLNELVLFISKVDILLACSTGPLHIAASTGVNALGVFSNRRPIHPGRWRPIGRRVKVFTYNKESNINIDDQMKLISPSEIFNYIKTLD